MVFTDGIKERNEQFIKDQLIPSLLTLSPTPLPINQLMVFFHTSNGLGYKWGANSEKESRNIQQLLLMIRRTPNELIEFEFLGKLKPDAFIHNFDNFFSVPGYRDMHVLPGYLNSVDSIAGRLFNSTVSRELMPFFLGYLYMLFLVIHPFVDGNGRVARNLVHYYNLILQGGLDNTIWYDKSSLFHSTSHHAAFEKLFFDSGVQITIENISSHFIINWKKAEAKLVDFIIETTSSVNANPERLLGLEFVQLLVSGMRLP